MCGFVQMISKVLQKPHTLEAPSAPTPSPPPHGLLHFFPFPLQSPQEAGATSQTGPMGRLQDIEAGTFSTGWGHHAGECILGCGSALIHVAEVKGCLRLVSCTALPALSLCLSLFHPLAAD